MPDSTAYYKSPVGTLILHETAGAVSAILFANSQKGEKVQEKDIVFEAPSTMVLIKCFEQLDEYFAGKRKVFDLPLSQQGTEFQKSVWNKLLDIPFGRTISYKELSKRIGNIKAIRAVGTTNGNNSICIIVPCHRVIGSNGDLTGYGGDLWRKKWLLDHESSIENGLQKLFNS